MPDRVMNNISFAYCPVPNPTESGECESIFQNDIAWPHKPVRSGEHWFMGNMTSGERISVWAKNIEEAKVKIIETGKSYHESINNLAIGRKT